MNKKKKKEFQKTNWKKLQEKSIPEFQNILSILNRYYNQLDSSRNKTESFIFREDVSKESIENLEIYLKKFGEYEFLILAKINNFDRNRSDSWIHIDGISEERNSHTKANNSNHPVFQIVCLQDLYEEAVEVEEEVTDLKELVQ
jgi:hypothetical protein